MTEQNIQDFWKTCEEQLKKYTDEFNNKMGVHGFKVEYIVLDKIPVALIYGLIMKYQGSELHSADCLLRSLHLPEEIITNIKTLLREIQT